MLDALAEAFSGNKIVTVHDDQPDELVLVEGSAPWDGLDLYAFTDAGETQARLVAVLDNLGKGASGAAVQNLNLMCGLPENAGLNLTR